GPRAADRPQIGPGPRVRAEAQAVHAAIRGAPGRFQALRREQTEIASHAFRPAVAARILPVLLAVQILVSGFATRPMADGTTSKALQPVDACTDGPGLPCARCCMAFAFDPTHGVGGEIVMFGGTDGA